MDLDISVTQQKRAEKIERMRRYFERVRHYFTPSDQMEIYEWTPNVDETIDFKYMTDEEVAKYLQSKGN